MKQRFLSILLVMIGFFIPATYAAKNASVKIPVQYIKTSDGDTARFQLDGENVRVRFLGINTPEVSGENKVEEPYGNEALAYTKHKLENAKKIEIEYDDVADREDRFGRKLAWIWIDDELFELELLEQGLAKTYMLKNNYRYATELKEAESRAKNQKVGLWSNLSAPKENTVEDNVKEDNTVTNEKIDNNTIENESENNMHLGSYIVVVIIIGIIIFYLKNKTKN